MELVKTKNSTTQKIKNNLELLYEKYSKTALISILAFFIGRIEIFAGLSPFSLPLLLAADKHPLAIVFTLMGILSNRSLYSVKYVLIILTGVILTTLIKWIFPAVDMKKVSPSVCFLSVFIYSLSFTLFKEYVIFDILLVVFESVIAFLSYFPINKGILTFGAATGKKYFTGEEITTFLLMVTLFTAGIGTNYIFDSILLKNILAVYIVFLGAGASNMGTGAQIAAFMGIAAGLGSEYMGVFIATYCVNGLIASTFSGYGKIAIVAGFTLGNVFMSILMAYEYYMVISFPEILIASLFYFILPDTYFKKIFSYTANDAYDINSAEIIKKIATVKLERLSLAFKKLSDTIFVTGIKSNHLKPEKLQSLYKDVSDKVCRSCALRFYCWQKDYDLTEKVMHKAITHIKDTGNLTKEAFPEHFKNKCVKLEEITNALITNYEIYRLNSVWENKVKDITLVYKNQFSELSDIVSRLKYEIDQNPYFDKTLSVEISSALENEGLDIKELNVIKDCNENTVIEVSMFPCQKKDKCYPQIEEKLSDIMDAPFVKTAGKCSYKECVLKFKESEKYFLRSSVRQKSKNDISGDSYSIKTLDNSSRYILLCDGSGSGEIASGYSKNTVKLMEEFLKTGFSKSTSVKLINSSLLYNFQQDNSSTIDLGILDLKNGELEILKKGACPTYIKKKTGEYSVIRSTGFPVGILDETDKIQKIKLSEGDILIMISDGIYNAVSSEDWILEALKAINSDDPDIISDTLLKICLSTKRKDEDDMTVIAGRVCLS